MNNTPHQNLIQYLRGKGALHSSRLEQALYKIRRQDFVSSYNQTEAYVDHPLGIGFGQTISQPSTVVFMLEELGVEIGDNVLDIGSGSGWQLGLLAEMVGPSGRVTGVEIIQELVLKARHNIAKYNFANVQIIHGDGNDGFSLAAPYDKIIVACATSHDVPSALLSQLRLGGKLIIPVGEGIQDLFLIKRTGEDQYKTKRFPGFMFVPFVKK